MSKMNNVMMVNITWNPDGWRTTYINPKAGHSYARNNVGHESLNFNFNKKGIDDDKFVYGFVQWTNAPKNFEKDGIIIFYTTNTNINSGQIVGLYGKANVIEMKKYPMKGFQNDLYCINIRAEKEFSMLFPIPLMSKQYSDKRLVGQVGFEYKDLSLFRKIIRDEIMELKINGILESELTKLKNIFEYYTGEIIDDIYDYFDLKEQDEVIEYVRKAKTRQEIIKELDKCNGEQSPEKIKVNQSFYKRDNVAISYIKVLRNFECQICKYFIKTKEGKKYIEAAHITPKNEGGKETLENIMLLCPNHHKEFDWGDKQIKYRDKNKIIFVLNDKEYEITLSVQG